MAPHLPSSLSPGKTEEKREVSTSGGVADNRRHLLLSVRLEQLDPNVGGVGGGAGGEGGRGGGAGGEGHPQGRQAGPLSTLQTGCNYTDWWQTLH